MAHAFEKSRESGKQELPEEVKAQRTPVAGLPNSLIMRIMEEPDAEQEADRLSGGVTSRTPDGLRREMGSRLGADFSSVRFHSDSASVNKSRAMGARAWAQGQDVYFGRGGFEPSAAAHELVHTFSRVR